MKFRHVGKYNVEQGSQWLDPVMDGDCFAHRANFTLLHRPPVAIVNMVQVLKYSQPALGITLEGGQSAYSPGDTIIGRVHRHTPVVSPHATIKLSLYGRSQTRLMADDPVQDGRFKLIDHSKHTYTLFEGPLHIPEGRDGLDWPFAITIPTHVDRSLELAQKNQDTFLPLHGDSVGQNVLPTSYTGGSTGDVVTCAFVEYFLQAMLLTSGQRGSGKCTSLLPVEIRNYSPDPPIIDVRLKRHHIQRCVTSHSLISRADDAFPLSTSQRMRRFIGATPDPSFVFRLEVDTPGIVQLDNPNPMPFRLRIVPLWERTSKVIQNMPQRARLAGLTLNLREVGSPKCERGSRERADANLRVEEALERLPKPIEIPCTDELPPVDVGEVIGLQVSYDQSSFRTGQRSSYLDTRLVPDFTTYNIQVRHWLNCRVQVEIAGEKVEWRNEHVVSVLPPSDPCPKAFTAPPLTEGRSESWIRPPDETDAPPPFSEV